MSIYGALRSGVSGLFVQSQSMAMLSDNIANVNTIGYKSSRPRFSTLVTSQSSPTLYSSGGVKSTIGREIDAQGLLQASPFSTDIAVSGKGFFVVSDSVTTNATGNVIPNGDVLFTRAGEFRTDKDGNLVNSQGFYLTGWPYDQTLQQFTTTNVLSSFSGINVAGLTSNPVPTSSVDLGANLQASAAATTTYDIAVQIFDRQGGSHTMTLTFTKTATANEWTLDATVSGTGSGFEDPDANDDGVTGDTQFQAGSTARRIGTVTFNADGTLASLASTTAAPNAAVASVNASNEFAFTLDYDGSIATTTDQVAMTLDLGTLNQADGLTQFEGAFTPNFINQNGKQFGSLTGVTVNESGEVTALFDNGETRLIYQVPLVTFNNPNGLEPKSGNVWIETDFSGSPVALAPNTGGAGLISPGSLEASTVDLADELTNMIVTQRAYSASTRIITTADEMLEELIRVKR